MRVRHADEGAGCEGAFAGADQRTVHFGCVQRRPPKGSAQYFLGVHHDASESFPDCPRGKNYMPVASLDFGAGRVVMVHCKVYPGRDSGTMP